LKTFQYASPLRYLLVLGLLIAGVLSPAMAAEDGVVRRAVVSLHKYPSGTSECVTQALLNEPVKITSKRAGWLKVELPAQFDYPGWIEASAVAIGARPPANGIEVTAAKTDVRAQPSESASVETQVFLATVLERADSGEAQGWTHVRLPGDRTGWVRSADVKAAPPARAVDGAAVMTTARRLMGTPYVWGGMSVRGVDCSGFTHTIYRLNGIKIHRDADQQFDHDGVPVRSLRDLQPGDLVFFKTYLKDVVSHVGFYLGNGKILEASSRVKGVGISNLSDPYLMKRYAGARRIIK
jgi:cell wall-associated NlpC family hydrolase